MVTSYKLLLLYGSICQAAHSLRGRPRHGALHHRRAETTTAAAATMTGIVSNCNKWYTIKDGDNCGSVEKQFGITHETFLEWNPAVSDDCLTNFWLNTAYCVSVGDLPSSTTSSTPTMTGIVSNCNKWYTIKDGDNCGSVEKQFDITHETFLKWNTAVSEDCLTNFWLNTAYCVGTGPLPSTTKASVTTSSSLMITTTSQNTTYSIRHPITSHNLSTPTSDTSWPPKQTQTGQPASCQKWYQVEGGDTCDTIHAIFGTTMSEEDFLSWNPAVLDDCSGLYLGWWVCVGVKPDSSLVLSYPTGSTSVPVPLQTPFVPSTISSMTEEFTASPTQNGLATGCQGYHQATSGDTCNNIMSEYNYMSAEDFLAWNPAVGEDCNGLWASYYYCVAAYPTGSLPMPPTVTTKPSSTPAGTTGDCKSWYQATDDDSCSLIVAMFGTFSESDFSKWNPNADCSNSLESNDWYCVGVAGTPTTRTAPISTTAFPTSNPIQTGIANNCSRYWLVSSGDTCDSITSTNQISLDDFYTWNPAVGTSSCDNLVSDYEVCVGIDGGSSATSTQSATTGSGAGSTRTTSSAAQPSQSSASSPAATPSPIQNGMTSGCKSFYFVVSGDGCWAIANDAGIALDDFYKWNPAVGDDCANLWPDYYVCIGV